MKDLPIKFWAKRGHFVINAARVGLSVNHGNFATEKEAVAEAEKLKAKFVLGHNITVEEKPKLFSVNEAVAEYKNNQEQLQTKSYHSAQVFNLDILLSVKYDGIDISKHQIERLGRKSDREDFRTCIELAIKNEGQSIETMHTRRKHWSKFFTFAAGKGWIDANPITDIKLPKKSKKDDRAPKVQKEFISWLQTDGLDAYSKAYALAAEKVLAGGRKKHKKRNELTISPNKLELMMVLSMTTGLRQGELRALRRCDYSANRQIIKIRGGIDHGTQDIGLAKTDEGQDREIEVPQQVCAMLDNLLATSKFKAFDDLVFPSTTGTPLRKNDFSQACKPIRAACPFVDEDTGKPLHFLWSDLRHAFASNLIDQLGANWAEVAESMGHTNANFTRKQYGHYIVDDEKSARKREAAANILVKKK
jgi:integrase